MAKKVTKTTKQAKAKTTAKAPAKAAPAPKGQTVLKTICAKVGIDPKTARRILRKRMRSDVPQIAKFHEIKQRWVQSPKDAQVIEQVLRDYAKAA
jgi:hypothetical protein